MSPEEANEALEWGLRQCGLDHWNVNLFWIDERPAWVKGDQMADGGGRSVSDAARREARIWVGPLECKASGNDPLTILFHEIRHAAIEALGIDLDNDLLEFDLDRMAETMAFSYRGGMKPWR